MVGAFWEHYLCRVREVAEMMTREEWLLERRKYVTASDVGALLDESPYKTRAQLIMEKLGLADDWTGDENSRNCERLETVVLDWAREDYGWNTHHNKALFADGVCPRLGATPDAWMDTPWGGCVVQVKVMQSPAQEDCKPFTAKGVPSTAAFLNGPPLHIALQVQSEMAVMECSHAVVLVLHRAGPLKLRPYYIARHEGAITRIRREVVRFWDEITEGTK